MAQWTDFHAVAVGLNTIAHDIGLWRRSKQFFTPDARRFEYEAKATLTEADAMLGKLMLVVSECAEAAEACRKGDFPNFCEEIADTFIRLFDIVEASGIDLATVLTAKMEKNWDRPIKHGKKTVL
jgi:NTP pyrophosphatase (non-canonical NTP hydrolase)